MMKQLMALMAVLALNATVLPYSTATTIEWGDFGTMAPPTGGPVSTSSGDLTFDVNYITWSANNFNTSTGAAASTNNILDWNETFLLQGGAGQINYQLDFDNIVSHDGSLYFAAIWLSQTRPITITAFDVLDVAIDLSTTTFVDTFFGSGSTTWNGATGQLRMLTGGASDNGGIVDLSSLGIDRLNVSYTAPDTLDGFSIGLASNQFVPASVPTPGTFMLLIAGIGLMRFRFSQRITA